MSKFCGYLPEIGSGNEDHVSLVCGAKLADVPDACQELISSDRTGVDQDRENLVLLAHTPIGEASRMQGRTNTCVAHGFVIGGDTRMSAIGRPVAAPSSRRQPYTLSLMLLRRSPKEAMRDEGTYCRILARALETWGACRETDWPFAGSVTEDVPPHILQRASSWKLKGISLITSARGEARARAVRAAIDLREPVPVAGPIDQVFSDYNGSGVLPAPGKAIGQHMTLVVGYRLRSGATELLVMNWWPSWGFTHMGRSSLAWASAAWLDAQREVYRMSVNDGRRS